MTILPHEVTAIERQLTAEHADRQAKWDRLDHILDIGDSESRLEWARRREEFFVEVGPIVSDSDSRAALRAMKDRYRGERIFVIGNGPSLNRTPLHLLEDEYTFGVNRIYLLFDRISWRPTFYTTVDWRVASDCAYEINELQGMHLFFPERFRGLLRDGDDVTWYWNDRHRHPTEQGFASDASLGIRGAGSVTGAAIQLAFHLGFDPIYLIGCDVTYSVPDTVIQEGPDQFGNGVGLYLTSTRDDDTNHFDKRYFGVGKRWHDPNVKRMIEGFEQCRDGAERHGRRILNATAGGNLEVFERVDIRSLFPKTQKKAKPRAAPDASLAGFVTAALCDESEGLMIDVGAGAGSHLSAFAGSGWEVRAFEPDPSQRRRLQASCPYAWRLFIDPRSIDSRTGPVDHYQCEGIEGVLLSPAYAACKAVRRGVAVTAREALEPLDGASPTVLAIDANHWELEILRSWPWAEVSPRFLIVGVDDRTSPQFGFNRRSIAKMLEGHGYQIIGIDDNRGPLLPDEEWLSDLVGDRVWLIGAPVDLQLSDDMLIALGKAHQLAVSRQQGDEVAEASPEALGGDDAQGLARDLPKIRDLTRRRLGRVLVQTGARARIRARTARRRLSRYVRGGAP